MIFPELLNCVDTNFPYWIDQEKSYNGDAESQVKKKGSYKSAWIVISDGLCIAKSLENSIGLQHLLFNPIMRLWECSQRLQNMLCGFSFPRARFSTR